MNTKLDERKISCFGTTSHPTSVVTPRNRSSIRIKFNLKVHIGDPAAAVALSTEGYYGRRVQQQLPHPIVPGMALLGLTEPTRTLLLGVGSVVVEWIIKSFCCCKISSSTTTRICNGCRTRDTKDVCIYNSVGGGWDIEIPFKRPIFRQQQEPQSRQEEHFDVLLLLFCCS